MQEVGTALYSATLRRAMAQLNAESLTESGDLPAVIKAHRCMFRSQNAFGPLAAAWKRIGLVLSCTQHVQLVEHVGDLGIGHETLPD